MICTSKSKSDEQQKAEIGIGNCVEKELSCLLKRNERVVLAEEVHIVPDLYSEKDRINFCVRNGVFDYLLDIRKVYKQKYYIENSSVRRRINK